MLELFYILKAGIVRLMMGLRDNYKDAISQGRLVKY